MCRKYSNKDGLKIELPEAIYQEIKDQVDGFYPNECGGIFVGQIPDGVTAKIEKMVLPKKFSSTPVYFVRLNNFINGWLKRLFTKYNGDMIYLGEWHSHPDGQPYPSTTDLNAMKEIALNPDIRIQTPLLLIVGYNKKIYDEKFYIYKNNKLNQYNYEEN